VVSRMLLTAIDSLSFSAGFGYEFLYVHQAPNRSAGDDLPTHPQSAPYPRIGLFPLSLWEEVRIDLQRGCGIPLPQRPAMVLTS
jgi:hypothetical protein